MRKPNALFLPAALAVVLAAGGCSPAPGPGGGAGSARACATPAAPYLKPAGRAAGGIRWVVRLASCFPGDKTEPSGLASFASAASPSLSVAYFQGRAWGVDTATGRVRWSRRVPQARRLPPQPQPIGTQEHDAVVAVLPHDVMISVITQVNTAESGGKCGCGAAVADLNPATGAVRHVSWIPLRGGGSFLAGGKVVLVSPSEGHLANGTIAAVDPATGKTWTRRHLHLHTDTGLAAAGNVLYADVQQLPQGQAGTERYLDAYSLRTGASLPRLRLPEPSGGIFAPPGGSYPGHGRVLVSSRSGGVDAVDPGSGALAWRVSAFQWGAVAPSQHALWAWRGSRLFAYDLSTGKLRFTAPVSRQQCWGSIPDVDQAVTALGPATMLCPQHTDVSQPYSAVRLKLFSLATGKLAGRTTVLPGWSSGSLAGHLAIGITCAGPNLPAKMLPGKCSEYDLAAISTG